MRFVEYALLLGNATTAARAGFFLDCNRESLMVEERHLKALRDCRPRQPHYLDRSRRGGGQAGWRVEPGGAGGSAHAVLGGCGVRVSPEKLLAEAQATGFRPDVLEKVAHLLGLLDAIRSHPFLRGKLALKGGTASNLFVFDVPRLSMDIDLNYVGAAGRSEMLEERPRLEVALQAGGLHDPANALGTCRRQVVAALPDGGGSERPDRRGRQLHAPRSVCGPSAIWTRIKWAVGGQRTSPWWISTSWRRESWPRC